MALILAIEPDRRQAAQIAAIARARLQAELVIGASAETALAALGSRIPDLILTPALLPARDEAALANAMRALDGAAAHVQSLTIPVLAAAPKAGKRPRGVLAALRGASREPNAPDGCDPELFAEQIRAYLPVAEPDDAPGVESGAASITSHDTRGVALVSPPQICDEKEAAKHDRALEVEASVADDRAVLGNEDVIAAPLIAVEHAATFAPEESADADVEVHHSGDPAVPRDEPVIAPPVVTLEQEVAVAADPSVHSEQPSADGSAVPATKLASKLVPIEPEARNDNNAARVIDAGPFTISAPESFVEPPVTADHVLQIEPPAPIRQAVEFVVPALPVVHPAAGRPDVDVAREAPTVPAVAPPTKIAPAPLGGSSPRRARPAARAGAVAPTPASTAPRRLVVERVEVWSPLLVPADRVWPAIEGVPAEAASETTASAPTPAADARAEKPVAAFAAGAVESTDAAPAPAVSAAAQDRIATPAKRPEPILSASAPSPGGAVDDRVASPVEAAAPEPIDATAARASGAVAQEPVAAHAEAPRESIGAPSAPAASAVVEDRVAASAEAAPERIAVTPAIPKPPAAVETAAFVVPAVAEPRPAIPAAEWLEVIQSLRRDIEQLRRERTITIVTAGPPAAPVPAAPTTPSAAAPAATAPVATDPAPADTPAVPAAEPAAAPASEARPRRRKDKKAPTKPLQDEWGLFDPEQCGFAALLAKLEEITEDDKPPRRS